MKMPSLFVGHGSPMNAIEQNAVTAAWAELGAVLPRPKAVLAVSAHWESDGTRLLAVDSPETIHDFSGFPRELNAVKYPAPGNTALAKKLARELGAEPSFEWGLDHGVWSVLVHLFPKADVPVIPLSLDRGKSPAEHLAFARKLAPLRQEGILIFTSGNIVHNLRAYQRSLSATPYPWAEKFDAFAADALSKGDFAALAAYENQGCAAELSAPTPEHFLPLLYAAGASLPGDSLTFPVTGYQNASISMRSVKFA